ncbi:heterokaryon incompatibility protein-domain-containing protein [Apiosordaria backusii]|uniref:Heterokaryon incompatibility protein-domain-containing protein n=1 Tax=Apiosordaria backusii TaxID=314023 RepID=A0AA40ENF7_9PEZI|nr:heterokaryon incompatibility protein-domain-containing protein [Apiosordaria backusii]
MENDQTCQICFNLNTSLSDVHYDLVQARALAGCQRCGILLSLTSHFFPGQAVDLLGLLVDEPHQLQHRGPLLAHVKLASGTVHVLELFRQPRQLTFSDKTCQGKKELRMGQGIGWARKVSVHSDSPECWKLAKGWLRNCLESHSECPGFETVPLPTRVLFLGHHCWGTAMPTRIMLTAESLDRWKAGVPIQHLPQTFQDAVKIARALKVDYLWIDTLCIMHDQENQDDWARESTKMADIYTNAILTISADQALDCHGGIFGMREKREIDAISLELSSLSCCSSGCSCSTIYVRRHRDRSYPFLSHSVDGATGGGCRSLTSGLHSRGWTLQERLLSKRVLHFTRFEMAWECTKEVACECRLGDSPPKQFLIFRRAFVNPIENWTQNGHQDQDRTPKSAEDEVLKQIHGPLFQEAEGDLSSLVQLHWQLIILEFTARCLTIEMDRLAALAGIADLLCRITVQEYYYGLLSDHLVRGLLWRHKPHPNRKRVSQRLPAGSAPSWSFGAASAQAQGQLILKGIW